MGRVLEIVLNVVPMLVQLVYSVAVRLDVQFPGFELHFFTGFFAAFRTTRFAAFLFATGFLFFDLRAAMDVPSRLMVDAARYRSILRETQHPAMAL